MSCDSGSGGSQANVEFIMVVKEEVESSEDPPQSEWSSLEMAQIVTNPKKELADLGLYTPDSGEICAKYIALSDSAVFRHSYYKYPSIKDPGIEHALLSPPRTIKYADDGQEYYKALCEEMKICPCRIFYRGLLSNEINLNYYGINPSHVRAMAKALSYNRTVTTFNLTDNFLTDDACFHLSEMLITNVKLKTLIMAGCHIGPSGMANLKLGLTLNQGLQSLDLSRNKLGEEGGVCFANCIGEGHAAPELNLSSNNLGPATAHAFSEIYEFKKSVITHLNLSWNNLYKPGSAKLLDSLLNNPVIVELNLSWNNLESERIALSISKIMALKSIEVLDISNNKFKNEAAKTLAAGLAKSRKLQTLNLSFNPLTSIDASIILDKLLNKRVKLQNLLMENIWVRKPFLVSLRKVKALPFRRDVNIVYGGVLENWTIRGPDVRELLLKRAVAVSAANKKHKIDILLYFLQKCKENPHPFPLSEFTDAVTRDTPLDQDLVTALAADYSLPGRKAPDVDLSKLKDYIHRLWPNKKLPTTPPPEPEPVPEPAPPPPPQKKEKDKKKKK